MCFTQSISNSNNNSIITRIEKKSMDSDERKLKGIQLSYLKQFVIENGGTEQFVGKTIADVIEEIIKPKTLETSIDFVGFLEKSQPSFVGTPEYYICHLWTCPFLELLEALLNYFQDKDPFIWLNFCSNNLHNTEPYNLQWILDDIKSRINKIDYTIFVNWPWNNDLIFRQTWIFWELYCTFETRSRCSLALSSKETAMFLESLTTTNGATLNQFFSSVKCESSFADRNEDNESLHLLIQSNAGYHKIDDLVSRKCKEIYLAHIYRHLNAEIDKEESSNADSSLSLESYQKYSSTYLLLAKLAYEIPNFPLAKKYYEKSIYFSNKLQNLQAPELPDFSLLLSKEGNNFQLSPNQVEHVKRNQEIANFYEECGEYAKAEEYYERCFALFPNPEKETVVEKTLVKAQPEPAATSSNENNEEDQPLQPPFLPTYNQDIYLQLLHLFGVLYHHWGKYDLAMKYYQDCLTLRLNIYGDNHSSTLNTFQNMAVLELELGNVSIAGKLLNDCYEKRRKSFIREKQPETTTNVSDSPNSKATMELSPEDEEEFMKLPDILNLFHNLGNFYEIKEDFVKAEYYYRQCYEKRKKYSGPGSPTTLSIMNQLGLFYLNASSPDHQNYDKAEDYFRRTYKRLQQYGYPTTYPLTLEVLSNLGDLYEVTRDYAEALKYYLLCLENQIIVFGKEHTQTLKTMNNLAFLYDSMGNFSQAEIYYQKSLDILMKIHGKENDKVLVVMYNLADCLENQGNYLIAHDLYEECYEIQKKLFGEDDLDVLETKASLDRVCRVLKEIEESKS